MVLSPTVRWVPVISATVAANQRNALTALRLVKTSAVVATAPRPPPPDTAQAIRPSGDPDGVEGGRFARVVVYSFGDGAARLNLCGTNIPSACLVSGGACHGMRS